MLTLPGFLH